MDGSASLRKSLDDGLKQLEEINIEEVVQFLALSREQAAELQGYINRQLDEDDRAANKVFPICRVDVAPMAEYLKTRSLMKSPERIPPPWIRTALQRCVEAVSQGVSLPDCVAVVWPACGTGPEPTRVGTASAARSPRPGGRPRPIHVKKDGSDPLAGLFYRSSPTPEENLLDLSARMPHVQWANFDYDMNPLLASFETMCSSPGEIDERRLPRPLHPPPPNPFTHAASSPEARRPDSAPAVFPRYDTHPPLSPPSQTTPRNLRPPETAATNGATTTTDPIPIPDPIPTNEKKKKNP
ncbi:hypothetical protein QBC47DRAFT_398046 [Echria macrotheca]|uniref:Uncharacterized protein n=1 Tax=Echria macrotheca TaxID=438768 RepID=A0AAJ0BJ52_9PEZI|nr:hypothetical protein QBC47DRAFT_398046 [Echria macrotheca]